MKPRNSLPRVELTPCSSVLLVLPRRKESLYTESPWRGDEMSDVRKPWLLKRLRHLEIMFRSWPTWSSDFGSNGGLICTGLSCVIVALPFNRSFWKRQSICSSSSCCTSPLCKVASVLGLLEGEDLSLGDVICLSSVSLLWQNLPTQSDINGQSETNGHTGQHPTNKLKPTKRTGTEYSHHLSFAKALFFANSQLIKPPFSYQAKCQAGWQSRAKQVKSCTSIAN